MLDQSEEQFRLLAEYANDVISRHAPDYSYLYVSPACQRILGYGLETLKGHFPHEFMHPDDVEAVLRILAGKPEVATLVFRFRTSEGRYVWTECTIRSIRSPETGKTLGHIAVSRDITGRREAEEELRRSEQRYRSLVEASPDGVLLCDLDGQILMANQQLADVLGYRTAQDPVGHSLLEFLPASQHERARGLLAVRSYGASVPVHRNRFTIICVDGNSLPAEVTAAMVSDGEEPVAVTCTIRDVTDQQRHEEELRHLALHDALTSLPNRALIADRLEQVALGARREHEEFAVLLLDLNRFKEVNDTLGHLSGDKLLQRVATLLCRTVRQSDTVARLGGDEFVVLLPGADEDAAVNVAAKLAQRVATPLKIDGQQVFVSASIGIVTAPAHGEDSETLLRRADVAMYSAKRKGREYVVYDADADPHSPERLTLIGDLRESIDLQKLQLFYQPKVRLDDGAVLSVEALARWRHPVHGMVPPADFVTLAEQTGLIKELTRWVLGEAIRQAAVWQENGMRLPVAVNLSAWNLHDRDLVPRIDHLLSEWGLQSELLQLEITESAIMNDPAQALQTVERLRERGILLALDDFGVGYSSMSYLHELPINDIKIDRSFGFSRSFDDAEEGSFLVHQGELLVPRSLSPCQGYIPSPAPSFLIPRISTSTLFASMSTSSRCWSPVPLTRPAVPSATRTRPVSTAATSGRWPIYPGVALPFACS